MLRAESQRIEIDMRLTRLTNHVATKGAAVCALLSAILAGCNEQVDLGPVASGAHTVGVQAMGVLGGCNTGGLGLWGGELDVTTSILVGPPLTLDACKNGAWQTFNNPVFKNQGDCVSFVATQGRNPGQ